MTSKLREKKLRENVNKYLRTTTNRSKRIRRFHREEEETIFRDETSRIEEEVLGDIKGRI